MNLTHVKLGAFCIAVIVLIWAFYGNFELS